MKTIQEFIEDKVTNGRGYDPIIVHIQKTNGEPFDELQYRVTLQMMQDKCRQLKAEDFL